MMKKEDTMNQISERNFLIRYAISILVVVLSLTYVFYFIDFLNIISIFLINIITIKIGQLIASVNKSIIAEKNSNLKKKILFVNIVIFLLAYLFTFELDVVQILIYLLAAIIGHFIWINGIMKKVINDETNIEHQKINTENQQTDIKNEQTISNSEEAKTTSGEFIKTYQLEAFTNDNLKSFLELNKLNKDNYFFAICMPGMSDYALFGYLSAMSICNYIVAFDEEHIYLFELSRSSNKKIVNCMIINKEEISNVIVKSASFGLAQKLILVFNNNKKITFQVNKKGIERQSQIEKINDFIKIYKK